MNVKLAFVVFSLWFLTKVACKYFKYQRLNDNGFSWFFGVIVYLVIFMKLLLFGVGIK